MSDARGIAQLLIGQGWYPEEPQESVLLCPLRLQKLLYYVQGWHLGLLGKPLFHQPIEAWVNGPVVAEVFTQFKGKRDGIVPVPSIKVSSISKTQTDLIEMVWQEYTRFSPKKLIEMTHSEPAWKEARTGLSPQEKSSKPLSLDTMANFFREYARTIVPKSRFPMPDPVDVWQADEQVELHPEQTVSFEESVRRAKALRANKVAV